VDDTRPMARRGGAATTSFPRAPGYGRQVSEGPGLVGRTIVRAPERPSTSRDGGLRGGDAGGATRGREGETAPRSDGGWGEALAVSGVGFGIASSPLEDAGAFKVTSATYSELRRDNAISRITMTTTATTIPSSR
jgi:hypothetical protein